MTDDRQTDGRTMTYSEREREFTFANKLLNTALRHIPHTKLHYSEYGCTSEK